MNVTVIGASNKPQRYSYKAVLLLEENNHTVFPVHKRIKTIEDRSVYAVPTDIPDDIHTITLYVSADISTVMSKELLALSPQRIIFNPGAENAVLDEMARAQGIECLNACTLVLLKTGQF